MASDDWRTLNRAMWDEKAPLHFRSSLYDVAAFKAGRTSLRPHEITDLGDLAGRDLIHLQCHIGLDTLSLARRGAKVVGLDFSSVSIDFARTLTKELRLEADFVVADVYEAVAALKRSFDIVYTGVGALCWLPDIALWARVVFELLRPGGQLYLFEFHPLEWVLDEKERTRAVIRHDYFVRPEGYQDTGSVSYADASTPVAADKSVTWNHSLGEVITALVEAGLRIESLRELDRSVLRTWEAMEETPDGMFRFASGHPSLPLMYVLRASKPA
jgi:SAM-dependent methyltransferase